MFLVLFRHGVGKQAFLILLPLKPWNSTEIKEFGCGIGWRHLNKLLADIIAWCFVYWFENVTVFKVIVPEEAIFTDAVTKEISRFCNYLAMLWSWIKTIEKRDDRTSKFNFFNHRQTPVFILIDCSIVSPYSERRLHAAFWNSSFDE